MNCCSIISPAYYYAANGSDGTQNGYFFDGAWYVESRKGELMNHSSNRFVLLGILGILIVFILLLFLDHTAIQAFLAGLAALLLGVYGKICQKKKP